MCLVVRSFVRSFTCLAVRLWRPPAAGGRDPSFHPRVTFFPVLISGGVLGTLRLASEKLVRSQGVYNGLAARTAPATEKAGLATGHRRKSQSKVLLPASPRDLRQWTAQKRKIRHDLRQPATLWKEDVANQPARVLVTEGTHRECFDAGHVCSYRQEGCCPKSASAVKKTYILDHNARNIHPDQPPSPARPGQARPGPTRTLSNVPSSFIQTWGAPP